MKHSAKWKTHRCWICRELQKQLAVLETDASFTSNIQQGTDTGLQRAHKPNNSQNY